MICLPLLASLSPFMIRSSNAYVQSGGSPFKLTLMILVLDMVLSAFLDNVTTILLLAPVCVSLCDAVNVNPKPLLLSLAMYGNIGGTGEHTRALSGNLL